MRPNLSQLLLPSAFAGFSLCTLLIAALYADALMGDD